jgi:hypothetical protein
VGERDLAFAEDAATRALAALFLEFPGAEDLLTKLQSLVNLERKGLVISRSRA